MRRTTPVPAPTGECRQTAGNMAEPHPLYDVVVLVHVLSAIFGFGSLAITGVFAGIARQRAGVGSEGDAVRRYFDGGINWASRSIYSVPVLGFVLLAMSHDVFRLDETWVVISLAVWMGAVALAQLVIWPGERAIAHAVAAQSAGGSARLGIPAARFSAVCTGVMAAAAGEVGLFALSLVIMVAKPGR